MTNSIHAHQEAGCAIDSQVTRHPEGAVQASCHAGDKHAGQSVTMQARVDAGFARTLIERDAAVLGLSGPSAVVREGLRLVHERAREAEMAAAYDEFYRGERAPLPAGVASPQRD